MKELASVLTVLIVLTCALYYPVVARHSSDKQQQAAVEKGKLTKVVIFTFHVFTNDPVDGLRVEPTKVKEVVKALEGLPSVKIVDRNPEPPMFMVEFDTAKVDLGDLAKAVATVKREVKEMPGVAALLLFDTVLNKELLKGGLSKEQQRRLGEALRKVKGVDPKHSEAMDDCVWVALDERGGAKLTEITAAIKIVRQEE
jgi:copper chaperone CopZ